MFFVNPIKPISAQRPTYRTFGQNFDFNLGNDPQKKNSYDCRNYVSIDEKSLYLRLCHKKQRKMNLGTNGLTVEYNGC